jgi:hypothetical protein
VKPKDFVPGDWDMASLDTLRKKYQEDAKALPNLNATSGARGTIDPAMQRLGVAVALGLLPPQDAVYIYRDYSLKGDQCYTATYQKPPFNDKGFFSFTMYGSDKYLHDDKSNLNNRVIAYNPDVSFTMYYGSEEACGPVSNRLNTPGDNWYLGMRIYRPGQSVIDGKYEMPTPVLVGK